MRVIITCPRCDESGDPDSSIYDDAYTPEQLRIGERFIRETTNDPFFCVVCEAKGVYCEAETSEG